MGVKFCGLQLSLFLYGLGSLSLFLSSLSWLYWHVSSSVFVTLDAKYSPNRACTDGVLTVLPSSLDLLNSVVRECRPETAGALQAAASHGQEPGSKIQESGNPGFWKSGIKQVQQLKVIKIKIRVTKNIRHQKV